MYRINKLFKAYIHKARHITQSSADVKYGDIFYCIKGASFDGHKFINQAFKQGAIAVVATRANILQKIFFTIKNLWFFFISFIFLGYKIRKKIFFFNGARLDIIKLKYSNLPELFAVTGTNGKTSSVHFYLEALKLINKKAISIGTIGIRANFDLNTDQMPQINLTTPDVFSLYRILSEAKKQGAEYCAMEASSIAIQSMRLEGLEFKITSFTNLTQDHLDIHKTMQNYYKAKLGLFTKYTSPLGLSVANGDDAKTLEAIELSLAAKKVVVYKQDAKALQGSNLQDTSKIYFSFNYGANEFAFYKVNQEGDLILIFKSDLQIPGFQCYNISMVLAGLCVYFGDAFCKSLQNTPSFTMPEGRMQFFKTKSGARVFVDYAHTPDALQKALDELCYIKGQDASLKIATIFGCGGDRDKTKRPIMGKIANDLSDEVVITDDNPRNELPSLIAHDVLAGIDDRAKVQVIHDRGQAIAKILSNASDKDIVLIAGKGHEEYQIYGNHKTHFSDAEQVLKFC